MRPSIILRYDSSNVNDGSGAQIQRIFGIRGLCELTGIAYKHEEIKSVTIHPLDPFQNQISVMKYLQKLNYYFQIDSYYGSLSTKNSIHLNVDSLKIHNLLKIAMNSLVSRKTFLLSTQECYSIIDYFPKIYKSVKDLLVNKNLFYFESNYDAIVHYRQTIGGFAIVQGQSISRQVPLERYISQLNKYCQQMSFDKSKLRLLILTDIPEEKTIYKPHDFQNHLWDIFPRQPDGTVVLSGEKVKEKFGSSGFNPVVEYGGDPLNSILEMSNAPLLLISRSSLSYVAAILNLMGTIYKQR